MHFVLRRKIRFVFITALSVLILYLILHSLLELNSLHNSSYDDIVCEITPEVRITMSDTLEVVVKDIFDTLDITYFLCYDSLWGALDVMGPHRWHQTIDICILNEDLVRFEEAFLIRAFKRKALTLSYESSNGVYLIAPDGYGRPVVRLYLFEALNSDYRRVGWKNRLVPPDNCELIHCFPQSLVAKPLPTLKFMSLTLPVPREGIEIQKYLFPNNWWLDSQPEECK